MDMSKIFIFGQWIRAKLFFDQWIGAKFLSLINGYAQFSFSLINEYEQNFNFWPMDMSKILSFDQWI